MGFSSEWMSIMKGIVSPAFTEKPHTPNLKGVFIDGQIQLMKPNFIKTMDMFYKIQFANIVDRYFKHGPDDLVVVLAFDNYAYVPTSKSMTQTKRKMKVSEVLPFTQEDNLPTGSCPPSWDCAMCNRVFKTKLIRHIVEHIGEWVTIRKKQKLILDHMGDPVEYSLMPGASRKTNSYYIRTIEGLDTKIGEADCKFPRWVDFITSMFPSKAVDIVVEATDSDYVMIAMMHYEHQCAMIENRDSYSCTSRINGLGRVSVRRILSHGKEHSSSETRKRKRIQSMIASTAADDGTNKPKATGRVMEFVHIPLLYEVMSTILKELFPHDRNSPMSCLAALISMAGGNDFCRNMPRLGPHRLWELLPLILRPVTESKACKSTTTLSEDPPGKKKKSMMIINSSIFKDIGENCRLKVLDEDVACDILIARVYAEIYSNHVKSKSNREISLWDEKTFKSLCECIKRDSCKLSQAIKDEFPSMERVATTIRNTSWTILYWRCAVMGDMSKCPDPMSPTYGYAMGDDGKPQWLDVVFLGSKS